MFEQKYGAADENTHCLAVECGAGLASIIAVLGFFSDGCGRVRNVVCRDENGRMLMVLDVEGLENGQAEDLCAKIALAPGASACVIIGRETRY